MVIITNGNTKINQMKFPALYRLLKTNVSIQMLFFIGNSKYGLIICDGVCCIINLKEKSITIIIGNIVQIRVSALIPSVITANASMIEAAKR